MKIGVIVVGMSDDSYVDSAESMQTEVDRLVAWFDPWVTGAYVAAFSASDGTMTVPTTMLEDVTNADSAREDSLVDVLREGRAALDPQHTDTVTLDRAEYDALMRRDTAHESPASSPQAS